MKLFLIACGVLLLGEKTLSAARGGGGVRCYDCNYDPDGRTKSADGKSSYAGNRRGFPKCALNAHEDHFVDRWRCHSETCFIRRDPNGLVYRGCADLWNLPWRVNTKANCTYQGQKPSLWWFCKGDLCNKGRFGTGDICQEVDSAWGSDGYYGEIPKEQREAYSGGGSGAKKAQNGKLKENGDRSGSGIKNALFKRVYGKSENGGGSSKTNDDARTHSKSGYDNMANRGSKSGYVSGDEPTTKRSFGAEEAYSYRNPSPKSEQPSPGTSSKGGYGDTGNGKSSGNGYNSGATSKSVYRSWYTDSGGTSSNDDAVSYPTELDPKYESSHMPRYDSDNPSLHYKTWDSPQNGEAWEAAPGQYWEPPSSQDKSWGPQPAKDKSWDPPTAQDKSWDPPPAQDKTWDLQPSQDKSWDPKPAQDKSWNPQPVQDKSWKPPSAKDKSWDPQPAQKKSRDTQPAQDKSWNPKPFQEKSWDTQQAEDKSWDPQPAQEKSWDPKPSQEKSSDTQPDQDKLWDPQPAQDKSWDPQPAQDKSWDPQPVHDNSWDPPSAQDESWNPPSAQAMSWNPQPAEDNSWNPAPKEPAYHEKAWGLSWVPPKDPVSSYKSWTPGEDDGFASEEVYLGSSFPGSVEAEDKRVWQAPPQEPDTANSARDTYDQGTGYDQGTAYDQGTGYDQGAGYDQGTGYAYTYSESGETAPSKSVPNSQSSSPNGDTYWEGDTHDETGNDGTFLPWDNREPTDVNIYAYYGDYGEPIGNEPASPVPNNPYDEAIPVLSENPCDGSCLGNPSGLFGHPERPDWFIQCGNGLHYGKVCHCCTPFYLRCPQGTAFDVVTRVCSDVTDNTGRYKSIY